MKFYIIAGEASGDLHASNLMKAISKRRPDAEFRVWGGDLMEVAGGELVNHYKDMSFMGFWEVITNLRTIFGYIKKCKADIQAYDPDVIILVDYPGFNLRIAEFAKGQHFRVFYYISPQVWAWHSSRVKKIKKIIDKMFVIFPFEKDFYKEWDYKVDFVGHPLLDAIDAIEVNDSFLEDNKLTDAPIVALLPGSRQQEIVRMLPVMTSVASEFPQLQFVVAGVKAMDPAVYDIARRYKNVKIVKNQTYQLLLHSRAALVTSGTATLETALFEVPQVVCYKGGKISYAIGKRLVNVPYISLVNLIMEQEVVKELIQEQMNKKNIKKELQKILETEKRKEIKKAYRLLKDKLGGAGASERTADLMLSYLKKI